MDVYLPIANLAVNGLLIVLLGGATGILSGIFGVGGGFLTTPLLIFYGIPPTVAAASAATQVTGASVSGVIAQSRRGESRLIGGIGCAELGSLPPKEGFPRPVLVDKVMALGMGPLGQQGWRRSWLWRMAGLVGRALRAALCFRGSRRRRQLDLLDLERACHLE